MHGYGSVKNEEKFVVSSIHVMKSEVHTVVVD
jgi:hypothetical protein